MTTRPHQYRSPALNDLLAYLDTGRVSVRVRLAVWRRVVATWWLDVVAVVMFVGGLIACL